MIPAHRHRNAHCLQAFAQELKKMQHDQTHLEPGELPELEPFQGSSSSIADSVKRRRTTSVVAAPETMASTSTEKQPSKTKRKLPTKKNNSKISPSLGNDETAMVISETTIRAQNAATLANKLMGDPEAARAILLHLTRTRSRAATPNTWPPRTTIIPSRFTWPKYPPLEAVLTENEEEYYQLAIHDFKSDLHLEFNNRLVVLVKTTAAEHGLEFDASLSDKMLRDRIRHYYTDHTANAKKRLFTMIGNPTKASNAKRLCELYGFLQQLSDLPTVIVSPETDEPPKDSAFPSHAALRSCKKAKIIRLCDAEFSL